MAIPLEPLQLDDLSRLRARFSRGDARGADSSGILVVSYTGTYRAGAAGYPDSRYMCAMGEAGIAAWQPDGLILDLIGLDYRWGDNLIDLFDLGEKEFGNENLPLAVVVGPASEDAIRSLLRCPIEGRTGPADEWVFRDFESAWNYVEDLVAGFWDRVRGSREI